MDTSPSPAVTDHLAWMRLRGLRPDTVTQRRRELTRLATALGTDLLDATDDTLYTWALSLHGAPSTIACSLANCSCFYSWAFDTGRLPTNPARKLPRPKVHKGLPRPMSRQHLRIALAAAKPDVRCWLALGAFAGLRVGEMSRLQRKDVLSEATPPVLLLDGKGGKQRIVPASSRVLFELRAYGLPSRGYIFRRRDGGYGPPSPARISQLVNEHLHELGIVDTAHATRHKFGTGLYQRSRDIRLVQELLGHADPATSAIYAAFAAGDAALYVEALGDDEDAVKTDQPSLPVSEGH